MCKLQIYQQDTPQNSQVYKIVQSENYSCNSS